MVAAPTLTVVIPAHDAEPWIGELLDSILTQDVEDMEVLVVDDRSADATAALVDAFGRRDPRVRRLASAEPGGAGARNTGAGAAEGEYIVFADADDLVPPGAYRSMLDSLRSSGSDMAVGDHLKFSATATWSPTKRWYPFDIGVTVPTILGAPELLTGRACWNRMFRRAFWEREALRFPDVGHADDIVPMTRAVLTARGIDVVPRCVYLYREGASGTGASMSNRADEESLLSYLAEETTCVGLVRNAAPELLRLQSVLVLDADGWVHVDRYLRGLDGRPLTAVTEAIERLLSRLDRSVINDVAAERRCLFSLLLIGEHDEAARFVAAMRLRDSDVVAHLEGWVRATTTLVRSAGLAELDRGALVDDGLVTAMLNHADDAPPDDLAAIVGSVSQVLDAVRPPSAASELRGAMRHALSDGDPDGVALVSELRGHAPVVVDEVHAEVDRLVLSGPVTAGHLFTEASIVLRSKGAPVVSDVTVDGRGWKALVRGDALSAGRWSVSVRLRLSRVVAEVPVITARMPLPPLADDHLLQPLSDRRAGWRFLIDRRASRSWFGRFRAAAARQRSARS